MSWAVIDAISIEREGKIVVVCLELRDMRKWSDGLNEDGDGRTVCYVDWVSAVMRWYLGICTFTGSGD